MHNVCSKCVEWLVWNCALTPPHTPNKGNISSTVPAASTSMSNVTESPSRQESGENRSALLDSICNFDKSALRKLA